MAASGNLWVRGRLARIFFKNAGCKPALPAKTRFSELAYRHGFGVRFASLFCAVNDASAPRTSFLA